MAPLLLLHRACKIQHVLQETSELPGVVGYLWKSEERSARIERAKSGDYRVDVGAKRTEAMEVTIRRLFEGCECSSWAFLASVTTRGTLTAHSFPSSQHEAKKSVPLHPHTRGLKQSIYHGPSFTY
jgi:hypothetical protein